MDVFRLQRNYKTPPLYSSALALCSFQCVKLNPSTSFSLESVREEELDTTNNKSQLSGHSEA